MASNGFLVRQRFSGLSQVRPGEEPALPSRLAASSFPARPLRLPSDVQPPSGPAPPAPPHRTPRPAGPPVTPIGHALGGPPTPPSRSRRRPAPVEPLPSSAPRPDSLFPPFLQRMSAFQINLNPLKEPLGFIKILEWFASIFAFATCGGFKGKTEIQVSCPSKGVANKTVTAAFGYPFRLNQASFHSHSSGNVCDVTWEDHVLIGDYSSSAQFYVTFAVFVFLYCMAALVLYVGYTSLYRESRKLPMIDFIVTLVATFLWLVSSSAWAKALTDIKIATGQNIIKELVPCQQPQEALCYFDSVTSMGSLNVSVIFGFLNMILWGGNAWFVYKETSLHSPSNTSASHSQGGVPPPSGM